MLDGRYRGTLLGGRGTDRHDYRLLVVEHGADGMSAIARIAELRKPTPDGFKRSPETQEQRRYVCDWIRELKDDVPERVE
jgi:hypothetical protein